MIDVNQPLELEDGTPVEFCRKARFGTWLVLIDGLSFLFMPSGEHIHGNLPNLRNVQPKSPTDESIIKAWKLTYGKQSTPDMEREVVRNYREFGHTNEALAIMAFARFMDGDEDQVDPDVLAVRDIFLAYGRGSMPTGDTTAALAAYKKHKNA